MRRKNVGLVCNYTEVQRRDQVSDESVLARVHFNFSKLIFSPDLPVPKHICSLNCRKGKDSPLRDQLGIILDFGLHRILVYVEF
jgi:hypothetical protein